MAATSPTRTLATALAAGVTVLLGAMPVDAQQANPEPTSCAGLAFTDAAGDAVATRENLDLKAGFFRYVTDSAGENVLTANIQVSSLDETLEAGAYWHIWRLSWTSGSTRQYVRAGIPSGTMPYSSGEVFYSYGVEGYPSTRRGTTGRMLLGRDGIIEIVVPVSELGLAGKRLADPQAVTEIVFGDPLHTYPPVVADRAPGDAGGKPFDVVPCAQEAKPTATQPSTAPDEVAGTPRLALEVVAGKLSARRINRRRSLAIGLRAPEKTTGLHARLTRGKRLVATGRLASVSGKGKVRLRLRLPGTKLTAGTYSLELQGRTASGAVASARVKVRIRP